MKHLFDDFPRDDEGRIVYGDTSLGCRHCGRVDAKLSEAGNLIYYHPGAECCERALLDQVRYREAEISLRKQRTRQQLDQLDQLEETVLAYGNSQSAAASAAKLRFAKAQKGIMAQIGAIDAEIAEIYDELVEARKALSERFGRR